MSEQSKSSPLAFDDPGGAAPEKYGNQRRVIGLISAGHFLSHFYALSLPPLFPILKTEFGVSYVELGLAVTAYGLFGGMLQAPVGFLVDRLGPAKVLLAGLSLNAAAIALMGFADVYWMLLALAFLAGLGNSVFHPADYAILSGSINPDRLGRVFSIHTFSGFLGGACAPVAILALAGLTGWRTALIGYGLVGLAVMAAMLVNISVLKGEVAGNEAPQQASSGAAKSGLRLLFTAPVLMFLAFFVFYGMASGGLLAFTVSGLINLHNLSLDVANTALTGHLFGVVGGILVAGFVADRYGNHLVTVSWAMLLAAVAAALPALLSGNGAVLIVVMVLAGVGLGAVLPPRDLMVRALIPPGESGKVFGFVFVGYSIGVGLAPLYFGWLLDRDMPAMVFVFSGVFAVLALFAIAAAHKLSPQSEES